MIFNDIGIVQRILSKTKIEVYDVEKKKTIVAEMSESYVEAIKDNLRSEGGMLVKFDENGIIIEDLEEI